MKLHYLSYGSNLHPVRLQDRVPSASLAGTVELPGRALTFSKRSHDGSGKCTIASADRSSSVFGAVYQIEQREKYLLDRIEGLGAGYDEHWEDLRLNGARTRAFVYVAASDYLDKKLIPYCWYKDLVLAGARYHCYPAAYIKVLDAVAAARDPDEERRKTNEAILAACRSHTAIP
jgi:hypothetical protein